MINHHPKICSIHGGPFGLWRLNFEEGKDLFGIGKYQFSKIFQDIQRKVFYKVVGKKFRRVETPWPSELWLWTYRLECHCRFESGSGEPTVRAKRVRSSRPVGRKTLLKGKVRLCRDQEIIIYFHQNIFPRHR